MNAEQKKQEEDVFEDHLTNVYGDIDICGVSYDAATVWKNHDEIAFNVGYADWSAETENMRWECTKCDTEFKDEEDAQACCEDIDNDDFDVAFLETLTKITDTSYLDDVSHNDLTAQHRSAYSQLVDSYQKDNLISERQAEKFTFNGGE